MQQRPTVVHLTRHRQVHNSEGVLYGRLPGFGLSELGHEMTARLAEYRDDTPLTHPRCSPLQRARGTLAPTAKLFPQLDVVIDEYVIEAANAFGGKVFGVDNKALCDVRMIWHVLSLLRPSWGEPYREIVARTRAAMGDVTAAAGPSGQTLVASHQLLIGMARRDAEGRLLAYDLRHRRCALVSVTSFTFRGGFIAAAGYVEPARDLPPAKRGRRFRVGA